MWWSRGVLLLVVFLSSHHAVAPEAPSCAKHETPYIIPVERAARSVNISSGQERAWLRVLAAFRSQQRVRIVAIGGSAMLGNGCNQIHLPPNDCSYTARFARAVRCRYYGIVDEQLLPTTGGNGGGIVYENKARGGSTTASVLPQLGRLIQAADEEPPPDVVFIDFALNDAVERQDWSMISALDKTKGPDFNQTVVVSAVTESLFEYLTSKFPNTAFALVEGICLSRWHDPRWSQEDALASAWAHERIAAVYGIPFISVPGLTDCAIMTQPKRNGDLHYGWPVHEHFSSILLGWIEAFNATKPPAVRHLVTPPLVPLAPAELRARFRVCPKELSAYDAYRAYQDPSLSLSPLIVGDTWKLAEDRPGKPRWITTIPGSTIDFPLSFGMSPRLTIVFMQGSETFGNAKLTMSTRWHRSQLDSSKYSTHIWTEGFYVTLEGTHSSFGTQAHAETINVAQRSVDHKNPGGVRGFAVRPFSNATMRIEFQPTRKQMSTLGKGANHTAKFAIVHVSSC